VTTTQTGGDIQILRRLLSSVGGFIDLTRTS
jgi:hypothetical protein